MKFYNYRNDAPQMRLYCGMVKLSGFDKNESNFIYIKKKISDT